MCARLIAAFKELLKIAAVPVGGVDRGVGRDDRERTQRDPAFLGDEFEQTAEAVMPWRPSGPPEVMRLTAAPRQLMPSRKLVALTSIGSLPDPG